MTDTVSALLDRIESEQPITSLVNARMQRIDELERLRQEHNAARASGNNGDSASRHSRRDQIIRQTTRQQRSSERRGFTSNIQRTPVRSMSYENTNAAINASTEQESNLFREIFDSSRQNLFGPRISGSTENLSSASFYGARRPSDTPLTIPRPMAQTGSDSGSGSSTPRTSLRPHIDLSTSLSEALVASRTSRYSSDTRLTPREPRSMSVTRETDPNVVSTADGSVLSRAASLRQNRMRDTRFRRRTIQGVDSSISQAIEQDLSSRGPVRSTSPLVTVTRTSEEENTTQRHELTHSSSFSSFSRADSYSKIKRTVELNPDDARPVLGLEDEKVIFIDNDGCCHWLNRHHQIVIISKSKRPLPKIVTNPRNKPAKRSQDDCDGYVAEMEEDTGSRYLKLKQLIKCAKLVDAMDDDMTDSNMKDLSLFELHKRGDYIEKENEDIDEKYKNISLYTPPREKPDLDTYLESKQKVVVPLYDGIPDEQLPPDIKAKLEPDSIQQGATKAPSAININQYAVARMSGMTQSNGVTSRYDRGRQAARQQQFYSNTNADGSSRSGYSRSDMDQSFSSERVDDGNGNSSSRQYASESRSQQSSVIVNDSVSSILRQRAEARRQQYLSRNQNGNVSQSSMEERHQQYISESQTNRNGNTMVQSSSQSNLEQFRSETRHSNGQSQTFSSQRQERSAFTHTSTTRLQPSAVPDSSNKTEDVNLVMERLFLMQGDDGPIDSSHLDYDEMRMIQKALEDNPSPPPSPEPYNDFDYNEADFVNVSSDTDPLVNAQPVLTSDERTLDAISEYSEGPSGSRRSESETSSLAVDSFVENVILNESASADAENNVVHTSTETTESSGQSSITSASDSTNLVVVSRSNSQSSTIVSSASSANTFITAKESVLTHSRSVDETVIESRLPRYQRLPADSADSRLPLPTMDWSPLEKANSPLSPTRFSFEEKKPEKNTAGACKFESSNVTKSTVPTVSKSSVVSTSVIRPSVHSELTIQIPDDNAKGTLPPVGRSDSSKSEIESTRTSASPVAKSRNSSRSGSEAPSPAGSETVTTVFEEFVQTIPRSLIEQWNSQHN